MRLRLELPSGEMKRECDMPAEMVRPSCARLVRVRVRVRVKGEGEGKGEG